MKFAKKIFVGIIAVALLVSCLALSTSAEAPTRPIKDITSVLEYNELETYLIENYEGYAEGEFVFNPKSSDLVDAPVFTFLSADGVSESVIAEGENKLLAIKNASSAIEGYKFLAEDSGDMLPRIVMSFDFKSGDAELGGSDIVLLATLCDYFEDVPLFSANLSGDEKSFTYAKYDMDRVTYSMEVCEVAPVLDTWYTVDVIYDLVNGEYSISISSEGVTVFSFANPINGTEGIDSIRLYVNGAEGVENVTYIDNFTAYNGSFLRDVTDPDNALADLLIAIHEYAKDSRTPIEEKLEISEAYKTLYAEYEIPEGIDRYDEVLAVINDINAFENRTNAEAFVAAANQLKAIEGYYAKIEFRDTVIDTYYDSYPSSDLAYYESIDGLSDKFDARRSYAQAIVDAKAICDNIDNDILEIKEYSENFVKQIEEGYNPASRDYEVMLAKYNLLSLTASKVDLAYRYIDVNPDTKYPTVGDAYNEYLALEAKIAAIQANVEIFVPAVLAMDTTEVDSVSAESPFLTVNFLELYENYLIANSVYKNGSVHTNLDPKTYTGKVDLVELISEFDAKKAYIESRIAECNTFISIVNGAYASTYFVTVQAELERAALYLDSNKEYSLEKFEGVEEAIATYALLLERVAKNKADAAAYIAAVDAIDLENDDYAALRAKVDAAIALQADGDITGIEGVEAANVALAKALAEVETLEGYSSTLIASVAALKDASSLKERRALIFTALSVKDEVETAISGVSDALIALDLAIVAYNSDVAALNALFSGVVSDAAVVITSAVADANVANIGAAIDSLN